jgi:hypothetical protein
MRRHKPKLALIKETLRTLSSVNLAHVVGGEEADVVDASVGKACPVQRRGSIESDPGTMLLLQSASE